MFVHKLKRSNICVWLLFLLFAFGIFKNVDIFHFRMNDIPETPTAEPKGYMMNGHCIVSNVIRRQMDDDADRITLILHLSHNRLDSSIRRQIANWDGPISIAVVFPPNISVNADPVLCAANFLKVLQNDDAQALKKLSAHFLLQNYALHKNESVPCSEAAFLDDIEGSDLEFAACNFGNTSESEKVQEMAQYPVNEARNLARNLSTTDFVLIADMDHLFSKNFESKMADLAKKELRKDPKVVLVYRIFEVANDVEHFPETKKDLYQLFKQKKAQEFHKFYGAHSIPKLDKWFQEPESNETKIQFFREYKSLHWEPQFVSLKTIPFHDTNFFYSIRDNTVLRWEMCRAGYKFGIVHDVFMFHPGIKTRQENKFIDKVRKIVTKKTIQAIQKFNQRMDRIYPKTKNSCPNFNRY